MQREAISTHKKKNTKHQSYGASKKQELKALLSKYVFLKKENEVNL